MMNVRGDTFAKRIALLLVLSVFIYTSFVLALHTISTPTGATNSILEDRYTFLNISINNTDANQTGNITGVTITLPGSFTFGNYANSSVSNYTNFSLTSNATFLNFTNQTYFLINGSESPITTTTHYFWFNATVPEPGRYTIVVRTFNNSGEFNQGNVTVDVNDTTNGTGSHIFPVNNTFSASSSLTFSANVSDNFNLSNIVFYIWNSSSLVNSTIVNSTNGTNQIVNFTFSFPRDDRYHWNFLVNDSFNNTAFNATNITMTYDGTVPSQIVFNSSTDANNTYFARNFTVINISAVDNLNITNITIFLWFGNGTLLNQSFGTIANATGLYYVNITNLSEGVYYYNATATDYANNVNTTVTRKVTIDLTSPSLANLSDNGADLNNSFVSRSFVLLNGTGTDAINISNVTIFLSNASGVVNQSNSSSAALVNISGLIDGVYHYNLTVTDYVNNVNISTITRRITVDATKPSQIVFNSSTDANNTYVARNNTVINISGVDNLNITNITIFLWYGNGSLFNQSFGTIANTTGLYYVNITNLTDGKYYYNATATDYANNMNTTGARTIYIDLTVPYNITFTAANDANNTFAPRNYTIVNITTRDAINASNITIFLVNASNSTINETTGTIGAANGSFYLNISNLADGVYYYNATTTDQANNRNYTATRKVTIDTTRPLVNYNGSTDANFVNMSRTWIFVNASGVTETNEANITFSLYYANGTVVNVTTFVDNSTRAINWTGLINAEYIYNVTVVDQAGNYNTTPTRNITLDTGAPSVTLSTSATGKNSLTIAIATTGDVRSACSASKGSTSFDVVIGSVISGQSFTDSPLDCGNSYTYSVSCTDYAGNAGSTTQVFSTDGCGGGLSGGSAGGGGGGAAGTTSPWANTFIAPSESLTAGYTRELNTNEGVKFTVTGTGGGDHTAGIVEVKDNKVKIRVSSTPQEASLGAGESKKFEVTNDTYYDLLVNVISITGTKANITFTTIHEAMVAAAPSDTTGDVTAGEGTDTGEMPEAAGAGETNVEGKGKSLWATLGIIAVLIVIVAIVVVTRSRKTHVQYRR